MKYPIPPFFARALGSRAPLLLLKRLLAVPFMVTALGATEVTHLLDDDSAGSLRKEIATTLAGGGTVVTFNPSLANGTITLASEILLNGDITIDGSGAPGLVVNGDRDGSLTSGGSVTGHRAFNIASGEVVLSNFEIENCYAENGGGAIFNEGNLTLRRMVFRNNQAKVGGGAVFQQGDSLLVEDSYFSRNEADSDSNNNGGGAINHRGGTLTIRRSSFFDNESGYGGGLNIDSNIGDLVNLTFVGNDAGGDQGGAIYSYRNLTLVHCTIINNGADGENGGGGIRLSSNDRKVTLINTVVTGNRTAQQDEDFDDIKPIDSLNIGASRNFITNVGNLSFASQSSPIPTRIPSAGSPLIDPVGGDTATDITTDARGISRIIAGIADIGAVEVQDGEIGGRVVTTLADTDIGGNFPNPLSLRQAIRLSVPREVITFSPSLFTNGPATITLTSGLVIPRTLTIDARATPGLTVSGNNAHRVFDIPATARVNFSGFTVSDGAADFGAGIRNQGELVLRDMLVSGNAATSDGGGLSHTGSRLLVANSTFASNTAATGAGVHLATTGDPSLFPPSSFRNATFASNVATFRGGGLKGGSIPFEMEHCTLAGNQASAGAGLSLGSATVNLKNTVITENTQSDGVTFVDVDQGTAMLVLDGVNYLNDSLSFNGANPVVGPALLAPLGDFGGPVPTRPAEAGSPLIDPANGDNTTGIVTTDARGFPRIIDGLLTGGGPVADVGATEFLPSIVVNTFVDENDGFDVGGLSLREALQIVPPSGVVTFDPTVFNVPRTLLLNSQIDLDRSVTIDASVISGFEIWAGQDEIRAFEVFAGATVRLVGFDIRRFNNFDGSNPFKGTAILSRGGLILEQMEFSENFTRSGDAAIFSEGGDIMIRDCFFRGNTSDSASPDGTIGRGGAISNVAGGIPSEVGVIDAVNTVFVDNMGSLGSAIYSEGAVTLTHCTVSENSDSAGIAHNDVLTINQTVVSRESGDAPINSLTSGTLIELGANFVGAGAGLGAERNFGGRVRTIALQLDSPLIDPVNGVAVSGLTEDATGRARVAGPRPDIGAFEMPQIEVDTLADENDGLEVGGKSLREAIGAATSPILIRFSDSLFNVDDPTITLSSQINITEDLRIEPLSQRGLIVKGDGSSRLFQVASNIDVLLGGFTLQGGRAPGAAQGGAIENQGHLRVRNMIFRDNGASSGGAIFSEDSQSQLTVESSTFESNDAVISGGAIYYAGARAASLISNSTFFGNTAVNGGALEIDAVGFGRVELIHCTIVGNSATRGGGLQVSSDIILRNTILTQNPFLDSDTNLALVISEGENFLPGDGDPGLLPLADNGGLVPTMLPDEGSLVINPAGSLVGSLPTLDARGFPRLAGDSPDIGAVETPNRIIVNTLADEDDGINSGLISLRDALGTATAAGDLVITFDPEVFGSGSPTITLANGSLIVTGGFVLDASTLPRGVTINGTAAGHRLVEIPTGVTVTLDSLIFTGGIANEGGGILNRGLLTLRNCTLHNNVATNGGGGAIRNENSLSLINTTITGNRGVFAGGVVSQDGDLTLVHTTVVDNEGGNGTGGLVLFDGTGTFTNSIIAENQNLSAANSSVDFGGTGSVQTFLGTNLIGDNTGGDAGLIAGSPNANGDYVGDSASPITAMLSPLGFHGGRVSTMHPLRGSLVRDPLGSDLPGLPVTDARGFARVVGARPDIGAVEAGNFTVNTLSDEDDGFFIGAVSLRDAIDGIGNGGSIFLDETVFSSLNSRLTLTNGVLSISANLILDASNVPGFTLSANEAGRAFVIASGATVSLQGFTIEDGRSTGDGGAIFSEGNLALREMSFSYNESESDGGAVAQQGGSLLVEGSTFFANTAEGDGGALSLQGPASLLNTTLHSNAATLGGAIANRAASNVNFCTITRNGADQGGGIDHSGAEVLSVTNSVLAENRADSGSDLAGTATVLATMVGGDPQLAELGYYGGRTMTRHPLIGSAVIDAANPGSITTDQRQQARSIGPDMGAVEAGTALMVTEVADNGSPGTLRSLMGQANLGTPVHLHFDPTVFASETTMSLQMGPLLSSDLPVFIDASNLPEPVVIDARQNHAVIEIQSEEALAMMGVELIEASNTGVINRGDFTFNDGEISASNGNDAGALFSAAGSRASLNGVAIFDSQAMNVGGIFVENGASLTAQNLTIYDNSGLQGGGISNRGDLTLRHATIVENDGLDLPGGMTNSGRLILENSVISENSGGSRPDFTGVVTDSRGANFVGNPNGAFGLGSEFLSGAILSEGFGEHGGRTRTLKFSVQSPLNNGGILTAATPAHDQRGFQRVLGPTVDLGATESPVGDPTQAGFSLYGAAPAAQSGFVFQISTNPDFQSPPVTTTFAGSGAIGTSDGARLSAEFSFPVGVAQDANDRIFIADSENHQIRMITPDGVVSTIAGTGSFGFANGPGNVAKFASPAGLTVDDSGNLYVADNLNHRIRKLTPPTFTGGQWTVSTFAGTNLPGLVDGSLGTGRLNFPHGLDFGPDGSLYIADRINHAIRRVTPGGVMSTVAGTGESGLVDGEPPLAQFNAPLDLSVNSQGEIFVADSGNHLIRKLTPPTTLNPKWVVETYAGSVAGMIDGASDLATFRNPSGIAVDGLDTIYVVDEGNHALRLISPSKIVSTLSGDGTAGYQDGDAATARHNCPLGLTVLNDGNILLSDSLNQRLRHVRTQPLILTPEVSRVLQGQDALTRVLNFNELGLTPATKYYFRWRPANGDPFALNYTFEFDALQVDVVTNAADQLTPDNVRFNGIVNPNGSTSTSRFEYSTDALLRGSYQVSSSPLSSEIGGVVFDSAGNLFLSDRTQHQILKMTPAGVVTVFAGSGVAGFADGAGVAAQFERPGGLAIDQADQLYLTDEVNHRIRRITPAGVVTTIAGSGIAGYQDGAAAESRFLFPCAITVSADDGKIYIADCGNNRIRLLENGSVSSVAGSAPFLSPSGLALQANGDLYIADTGNHRVMLFDTNESLSTVIGSGLSSPTGLTIDEDGRLIIVDRGNHRVVAIDDQGSLVPFAGSGIAGFADSPVGVLAPMTVSQFNLPTVIAPGAEGRIVVVDAGNNQLRHLTRSVVNNVSISGSQTGEVDQVISANPLQALSPGATYYFRAHSQNSRGQNSGSILSVTTPLPLISVFRGANTASLPLVNGQSEAVEFSVIPVLQPRAEAFTIGNNGEFPLTVSSVSVPTSYRFLGALPMVIPPGGSASFTVELFSALPSGSTGFGGEVRILSDDFTEGDFVFSVSGRVVTSPVLSGLTASGDKDLNFTVQVDPEDSPTEVCFEYSRFPDLDDSYEVTTLTTDEAVIPHAVEADVTGNIYLTNSTAGLVQLIEADGTVSDLNATALNAPGGIAIHPQTGILYVAETGNHRIIRILPDGTVSPFSGTGQAGLTEGVANGARFSSPAGIAFDDSGNLYVADSGNNRIRKVAQDGFATTLLGENGELSAPMDVAVTATGSVLIADSGNQRITQSSPDGFPSIFVNSGTFTAPVSLAINPEGEVLVVDRDSHQIFIVNQARQISVLAGSGVQGLRDGLGSGSRFESPTGVAIMPDGSVVIGDEGSERLRRIRFAAFKATGAEALTAVDQVDTLVNDVFLPVIYYRAVARNEGGVTRSEVKVLAREAFELWQQENFGSDSGNPAIAGSGADPDGDGRVNFVEYAQGSNPNENSQEGRLTTALDGSLLTLCYHRSLNAIDVRYRVSWSFDLITWNDTGVSEVVLSDDGSLQKIEASVVVPADENRFIRLELSPNLFTVWQLNQFQLLSDNPAVSGPSGDPDGDSLNNFQEYAMGLDPNANSFAERPVTSSPDGVTTLTYRRSLAATDVDYVVSWSNDLMTWSAEGIIHNVISDDGEKQVIEAFIPAPAAQPAFLRLELSPR